MHRISGDTYDWNNKGAVKQRLSRKEQPEIPTGKKKEIENEDVEDKERSNGMGKYPYFGYGDEGDQGRRRRTLASSSLSHGRATHSAEPTQLLYGLRGAKPYPRPASNETGK